MKSFPALKNTIQTKNKLLDNIIRIVEKTL